ncbi:protein FAR1-RELATED SEQUENCE 5-like [Salvia splendens]|uniref:protein FAR1-RELATED SEQUENCE 5-like n=1 Tax=Salvia splendens TaxID=180675 RepID=UPI001C2804E7|nr:protein FAR1-RELATED SEQUENCE 5-like [Salvia splendens]
MEIGSPTLPHCDNHSSSDESVDNTNYGDLHTPDCPIEVKPFVGRNFPTLEKAIQFYENYGRRVGFDTIKCGSKKIDQLTIWFYMACSREGEKRVQDKQAKGRRKSNKCGCNARVAFKFDSDRGYVINNLNEEHNHPMVLPNHQKFMRLNRVLDDVHQKFITDCVGFNIGPSLTFKLLTELMGGYESVGCTVLDVRNYTQGIRRYAEGHDAQMILDELRKKKESCDAFTYEYKFVKCMGGAPKLIITDQDLGMKVAIEEVLVNTRHRWCMWHIMEKVAEKVPKSLLGNGDFKELNSCVWSELIEPTEFEDTWHKIMEEYELEDTDWFSTVFRSRQYWVPTYFSDFPASSLIKTTYVSESQNSFFKRYSKSKANLVVFLMNFNNALEAQRHKTAKLDYIDVNTTSTLKTQWLIEKYASTIFTDSAFKEIQDQILEAYNHCISADIDQTHELTSILRDARQQIFSDGVVLSATQKKQCIESFYGGEKSLAVEVHPPEVVKTKGHTSRLQPRLEKAMRLKNKPVRQCKKCH